MPFRTALISCLLFGGLCGVGVVRAQVFNSPPTVVGDEWFLPEGATLNVLEGGVAGYGLTARSGSTVNVYEGGAVGQSLRASVGSAINVFGGSIGSGLRLSSSARLNLSGGSVGDDFFALPRSEISVSGGSFGERLGLREGVSMTVSGGRFGRGFSGRVESSNVEFIGGEFKRNGEPIVGDAIPLELQDPSIVYTGTFADGTPFLFSGALGDRVGGVTLSRVDLPTADAAPLFVGAATPAAPLGLRAGQTLTVQDGGLIAANFTAVDAGLVVEGGEVGEKLELARAVLRVEGGTVGEEVFAAASQVHIGGGTVGDHFRVLHGSAVSVTGGAVGVDFLVDLGSTLTVSGGSIGGVRLLQSHATVVDGLLGFVGVGEGSFIDVRGGIIDGGISLRGGTAHISGGVMSGGADLRSGAIQFSGGAIDGPMVASVGSSVELVGLAFMLDGVPVELEPGLGKLIAERDVVLTGILADGSPISLDLNSIYVDGQDWFAGSAELRLTLVPEPTSLALLGGLAVLPFARRFRGVRCRTKAACEIGQPFDS